MRNETILNVFPSSDGRKRLVIAIQQDVACGCGLPCEASVPMRPEPASRLVLRQESLSDDVGWFAQSCVAIEPEQLPGLKMALSGGMTKAIQPPPQDVPRVPAILRFDSQAVPTSAS